MVQLKAGYFTGGIESIMVNPLMKEKTEALLEQLSYFDLQTDIQISDTCTDASVAVLYNIISRGTPTYASQFIEDILSTTIGKTMKRISSEGEIYREIPKHEVRDLVFKALHIVEPRVRFKKLKSQDDRKSTIYDFINYGVVFSQGDYIYQFAEIDRDFQDIVCLSKKFRRNIQSLKSNPDYAFLNEKCDLSFYAPYSENTPNWLVYKFNLDDSLVDTTDWITEDKISNLLNPLDISGRVVIRKTDIPSHKTAEISSFVENSYFDIVKENYNSPLYNTEDGIEALQIALTPFAVARVQKVLLEAINSEVLSLEKKTWKIGVIERDVPCAFLAIEDLKQHFNKFFILENLSRSFPNVKLEIFYSDEFASTELNLLYQGSRKNISEFDPEVQYDLLIDVAVLLRSGFEEKTLQTNANKYAVIRSVKSPYAKTKLLFCNHINYDINISGNVSLSNQEDNEEDEDLDISLDEENSIEQQEALKFFLKNLFGKSNFLENQALAVSGLLNGDNLLEVSSPNSGKTISALLAAFLKPGYSFMLSPTIAVMNMQFKELRKRRIEIDYYINPALQNSFDRDLAVKDVTTGKSIVTFLSPSLVHDPYLRNIFKEINEKNIPLYFVFVDEAQRVCLQTCDFRPYYQDIKNIIAKNFADENINILRIGAFCWTLEKHIINETAQKLGTEKVLVCDSDFPKFKVLVRQVPMKGAGNTNDLYAYAKKVKQIETEKIISEKKTDKVMVFSWKNPFDRTIGDNEDYKVCGLETGYYDGDITELETDITSSSAVSSMKAAEKFIFGDTSVLSCTPSAGVGLRVKGLKNVIHFEPPLSLDMFCRMNSRGDKNSVVDVDLFLNTIEQEFSGTETVRDSSGNIKTAENVLVTDVDTASNLRRLTRQNPGQEKEKTMISQILKDVVFPQYSLRQIIVDAVYNEFNQEIQIDSEPSYNPYQLYIYANNKTKSLGFIDFKARVLNMPELQYDKVLAEKIQTYVFDFILLNTSNPLEFLSKLETENPSEVSYGVQDALDLVSFEEKTSVVIPFYNNEFFTASQMLSSAFGSEVSTAVIRRSYNQSHDFSSFEKMFEKISGKNLKTIAANRRSELMNIYAKFRNKRDTLRAISRLKEIDIIDDYLVNSAKEEIEIYMTKHNKDFYRMKLLPILQRNLTKEKVLLYLSTISEEQFLSIEKYTDVLIGFFYAEIYPLYEQSVRDTSMFFRKIFEKQKEGEVSQEEILRNLHNYFISRYSCGYLFDEHSSQTIDNDSLDGALRLIGRTEGNINEMLSLQARFDSENIEKLSYLDKIVYGYCCLFTSNSFDTNARFNSYGIISEGLKKLREKDSTEEFVRDFQKVNSLITENNYDLKKEAAGVLGLKLQHSWLKKFNSEILKTDEVL